MLANIHISHINTNDDQSVNKFFGPGYCSKVSIHCPSAFTRDLSLGILVDKDPQFHEIPLEGP